MPTLHWLNDDEARHAAKGVPYRLLEEDPALSYGEPQTRNMLIQGDNLAVLKSLLPYYAGQVKCIYIDPPYNTGSAFEHYDDNVEHSTWLTLMYPRLELLRDLLAEDGSIWVSIDDNECHYFKAIADEVFGRKNFVATIIWQKIYTVKNSARHFSDMHDYILVFAKNSSTWERNLQPRTEKSDGNYANPDNDPRGKWTTNAIQARNYYSLGQYEIVTPNGRRILPPQGTFWRVSKESFEQLDKDKRVWWGKDGNAIPRIKKFLVEAKQGVVPSTMWLASEVGQNAEAKTEGRTIFANQADIFITPKPERLINRIFDIATNYDDLILDSFLGSGTTAAVAHKMGRRYIGIEMGSHAITHCVPRLKKVVDGEQGGISNALNWHGGGGFRFYRLGEPVFDEHNHINPNVTYLALSAHCWFCETKTPFPSITHGLHKTPLLGVHNGTAYYLLFNGILGDINPEGGNVLTQKLLRILPSFDGPKVIYGEVSLLDEARLRAEGITFKKIPYELSVR